MVEWSVIIPSYNSEKTIRACLLSILLQKTLVSYEVIIIDSSEDESWQRIEKSSGDMKKEFRLKGVVLKKFHYKRRMFAGTARNKGSEKSRGKKLLFVDSDVILKNNVLEIANEKLKQYPIVGGVIDFKKDASFPEILEIQFNFNSHIDNFFLKKNTFIGGYLFAMRKSIFDEFKMKGVHVMEDYELSYRLHKNNFNIKIISELSCYHNSKIHFIRLMQKVFYFGRTHYSMSHLMKKIPFHKFANISISVLFPFFCILKWIRVMIKNIGRYDLYKIFLAIFNIPFLIFLSFIWGIGFIFEMWKNNTHLKGYEKNSK